MVVLLDEENRVNSLGRKKKVFEEKLVVETNLVAIDSGYSFIKVKSEGGEYCFPSIIVEHKNIDKNLEIGVGRKTALDGNYLVNNLVVTYEGETYYIGKKAVDEFQARAVRTLLPDRPNDEYAKILTLAGIGLSVGVSENIKRHKINLVTGLPVKYMKTQREKLAEELKGEHRLSFNLNGKTYEKVLEIEEVEVLIQPAGSFIDALIASDGSMRDIYGSRLDTIERVGIIDIGHHTTDFVIIDNEFNAVGNYAGSTRGVSDLYKTLTEEVRDDWYSKNIFIEPVETDIDHIVKYRNIKINNTEHSYNRLVAGLAENLAKQIFTVIQGGWQDIINRLDMILLTGGGTELLLEPMRNLFETTNFTKVFKLSESQLGNVRGYYKYGKLTFEESE